MVRAVAVCLQATECMQVYASAKGCAKWSLLCSLTAFLWALMIIVCIIVVGANIGTASNNDSDNNYYN